MTPDVNEAGGPAFPVSIPGAGDNGWHGMSLRDWFAGQVVAEMVHAARQMAAPGYSVEAIAAWSNDVADAMIKARALSQQNHTGGK